MNRFSAIAIGLCIGMFLIMFFLGYESLSVKLDALGAKVENRLPPSYTGGEHGHVVEMTRDQGEILARLAQEVVPQPASFKQFATEDGVQGFVDRCLKETVGYKDASIDGRETRVYKCFGEFVRALSRGYLDPNQYTLIESLKSFALADNDKWFYGVKMLTHKASYDPRQVAEFGQRFTPLIIAEINQAPADQRSAILAMLEDLVLSLSWSVTPEVRTAWNEYQAAEKAVCTSCVHDASQDADAQQKGEILIQKAKTLSDLNSPVSAVYVTIWRLRAERVTGSSAITVAWLKFLQEVKVGVVE